MYSLIKISKSTNPKKKLMAIFKNKVTGRTKNVHFGAAGYFDYILIKDKKEADKRKNLYIKRHSKNENWNDFTSAGSLSRWILWNKKTLSESISHYKQKFNI